MLLPTMKQNEGNKLGRREMAVWIGEIGTGGSAGLPKSTVPEKLASMAELVEFKGMFARLSDIMLFERR